MDKRAGELQGVGVTEAMIVVLPVVGMGDFEPRWLDSQVHCLFAALHRGASAHATTGVVLVPPLGHELAIAGPGRRGIAGMKRPPQGCAPASTAAAARR